DRRVIALDWPGYGGSSATAAPLATDELSDLLLSLLDAEGIESTHLLGFSMGAAVALHVAVAAPERVERLVLVSPYGIGGKQHLPLAPYLALRLPGFSSGLLTLVGGQRWALRWF